MRSLPLSSWPENDKKAWAQACQPTVRARLGGRAAHLSQDTRDDLQRRYGYLLQAEKDVGFLDCSAAAGSHVRRDTIERFLSEVSTQWSSVTVAMTVYKLRKMAEILNPHHSLGWLEDIEFDLRAHAEPRTRSENITSDQLLEVGETLFREAENASHLSPKEQAVLARNGLMIALLAVHPIRHRNLAQLTLSKSFRKIDERWWIILEASETKGRRADERQVPEYLTPLVDRYLAIFRPILLAQKASETRKIEEGAIASGDQPARPLWISRIGDPLTYSGVGAAITETTGAVLGQRLSPHAFRRAAKATVTFFGTSNPRMIQGVLQHQTFRTSDDYYDTSPSHRAALELTAIVRALMKIN